MNEVVKSHTLCQACKQREEEEDIPNITFSSINAKRSFTNVRCKCLYGAKATHCFIGCLARAKHANSFFEKFYECCRRPV